MTPDLLPLLTELGDTLTQIATALNAVVLLAVGIMAVTLVAVLLVWWRVTRHLAQVHRITVQAMRDITTITQAISEQTTELLRHD